MFVSDVEEDRLAEHLGMPVISFDQLLSDGHRDRQVVVAVGSSAGRSAIVERCRMAGLRFGTLRATGHHRFDRVIVGEGGILFESSVITADVRIGAHFQMHYMCSVSHDCVIGDFVTFAPHSMCAGRVHIGNGVQVGAGAVIRNGRPDRPLRVGDGAVIGMGAVVVDDVPAYATMVGSPARPIPHSEPGR